MIPTFSAIHLDARKLNSHCPRQKNITWQMLGTRTCLESLRNIAKHHTVRESITTITRPKELNFLHSSLRSTIKRTFGVLKKRFPILKIMPHYKQSRQGSIVLACCSICNWICIRMFTLDDK